MSLTPQKRFDGKISVLVPAYKRTSYLGACLESLRAQGDANLEIIVHDDTPDDSIETIVKGFGDLPIIYKRNDPQLGLVGKLNDFLNVATGKWGIVLCDDDIFEPGFIDATRRGIGANPRATSVRCRNEIIDESGAQLRLDPPSPEVSGTLSFIAQLFRRKSQAFTINLTGFAFPLKLMKKLGGFPQCYKGYLTDRFALTRLASAGDAVCMPGALCGIRKHDGSITSSVDTGYLESIASVRELAAEAHAVVDREESALGEGSSIIEIVAARDAIMGFVKRNLTRSVDHGLMALIKRPGRISRSDLARVDADLNDNDIDKFGSLHIYRTLARFPQIMRIPMANIFQGLKQRKHR